MSGVLYIVATPIGNLNDITYRAIEMLEAVDFILAEDTRNSSHLLNHYGIKKPLKAFHDHNESKKTAWVIDQLQAGQSIALVSDAGTPLISDPGYYLVHACRELGLSVVPIPGASAVITALSACGLPTGQFAFIGFLPAKTVQLEKVLKSTQDRPETIVAYESTHRILKTLQKINQLMPERQVVLAKELTKQFESLVNGTATDLLTWLAEDERRQKGEFVLILGPAELKASELDTGLLKVLLKYLSVKDAAKCAAELTVQSKSEYYALALSLKEA